MIHDQLFEIFHFLQCFVILHVAHICFDYWVLFLSIKHNHLNHNTWHSVESFKFSFERCSHFLLHILQNLKHLIFCEQSLRRTKHTWIYKIILLSLSNLFKSCFNFFNASFLFQTEKVQVLVQQILVILVKICQ